MWLLPNPVFPLIVCGLGVISSSESQTNLKPSNYKIQFSAISIELTLPHSWMKLQMPSFSNHFSWIFYISMLYMNKNTWILKGILILNVLFQCLLYLKCTLSSSSLPHFSVRKNPQTKKIQITSSIFKVTAYVSVEGKFATNEFNYLLLIALLQMELATRVIYRGKKTMIFSFLLKLEVDKVCFYLNSKNFFP